MKKARRRRNVLSICLVTAYRHRGGYVSSKIPLIEDIIDKREVCPAQIAFDFGIKCYLHGRNRRQLRFKTKDRDKTLDDT